MWQPVQLAVCSVALFRCQLAVSLFVLGLLLFVCVFWGGGSHFFKYIFVTKIHTWGTQGHAGLVHATFRKSYKREMK